MNSLQEVINVIKYRRCYFSSINPAVILATISLLSNFNKSAWTFSLKDLLSKECKLHGKLFHTLGPSLENEESC